MATLPTLVQDFSSSLSSLPPQLSTVNLTLVSSLLSALSDDLQPVAPALDVNQQLLSDSTLLSSQVSALNNLTSSISASSRAKASPSDLISLVKIFGERHDIFTLHSPDLPAIVVLFGLAIGLKLICASLLSSSAIKRTKQNFADHNKGVVVSDEVARSILRRPAVTACGRLLNLCIALTVFSLQLSAWHTFIISSTSEPIRYEEIARLYFAIKCLMVGYGADLLFSDGPAKLYYHHFFTFVLLFVGLVTAAETHNPKFFRLANWLLLQGTGLATEFFAMFLYQTRRYLKTQGREYRPKLQRRLLVGAYYFFRFSSIATYPQKVIPALVSLYWLNQMWDEMLTNKWGVIWLCLCTLTLSCLSLLQVYIYDSVHPLCNHMSYELYGGEKPSRHGPLARKVKKFLAQRRQARTGYIRLSEKGQTFNEKRPEALSWSSDDSTPSQSPSGSPSLDQKFDNFVDTTIPVPSVEQIKGVATVSL